MKKMICILLVVPGSFLIAQTKTVVTQFGEKVNIHPNANNGLMANNGYIQLGGDLTKPTTLTTSSIYTLAMQGLQTGLATDNVMLTDANGIIKTIKADALPMWSLTGNKGTDVNSNFLGTTDDVDLIFKRNSIKAGRLGSYETYFGLNAGSSSTVAIGYNLGIGTNALKSSTTGTYNIAIGNNAMGNSLTSSANIAIGFNALGSVTDSNNNMALGNNSLSSVTGSAASNNMGIGKTSLQKITSGTYNTAVGDQALIGMTTGSKNVALGSSAGQTAGSSGSLLAADNSIFIGYNAGALANAQTNQIVIGANSIGKGSNTVQIGDASMTRIGVQVAWSAASDVRLKKDIEDSSFGLSFINKLRPVIYHMKTGTKDLQTGFIAQEVEKAAKSINYEFSGVVRPQTNADNDYYSLRYSDFVVPLVKAVQEQQKQLEAKASEIKELKDHMTKLEKAVNGLLK